MNRAQDKRLLMISNQVSDADFFLAIYKQKQRRLNGYSDVKYYDGSVRPIQGRNVGGRVYGSLK